MSLDIILIVGYIIIFIFIFFTFKNLLSYMKQLRETIQDKIINHRYNQRIARLNNEKPGMLEKIVRKIDMELYQAGIRNMFPELTAEYYFILLLFVMCLVCVVVYIKTNNLLFSLLGAACMWFLNKVIVTIMRFVNKERTKSYLLDALNLMGNYSVSTQDLNVIIYQTGLNIPDPLGQAFKDCYEESRINGTMDTALENLRNRIDLDVFRQITVLLEFASKADSNYTAVIDKGKTMVHTYLKAEREKNMIAITNLFSFALLVGVCIFLLIYLINGMGDGDVLGFFKSGMGIFIIAANLTVFAWYIKIVMDFKK